METPTPRHKDMDGYISDARTSIEQDLATRGLSDLLTPEELKSLVDSGFYRIAYQTFTDDRVSPSGVSQNLESEL